MGREKTKRELEEELALVKDKLDRIMNIVCAEDKETAAYAAFGRWCLNEHRGEYGVGDIDGAAAEEQAVKLGLLESFEATEPCCDNCQCAADVGFPTTCLRLAFPKGAQ